MAIDHPPADRLVDGFEQIIYWVSADRENFDLSKFRSQLPESVRALDDHGVSAAPRDEINGPYHVFFSWTITDDKFRFTIHYHHGPKKHEDDEHEPFAEDVMAWFGQFFTARPVDCHIHVRYEYDRDARQTTFPMMLTAELPFQAEVYGVAMRLPQEKPNGASSVRLSRGKSSWYAEVVANRTITFEHFTPEADANVLLTVLDRFLEKRAI